MSNLCDWNGGETHFFTCLECMVIDNIVSVSLRVLSHSVCQCWCVFPCVSLVFVIDLAAWDNDDSWYWSPMFSSGQSGRLSFSSSQIRICTTTAGTSRVMTSLSSCNRRWQAVTAAIRWSSHADIQYRLSIVAFYQSINQSLFQALDPWNNKKHKSNTEKDRERQRECSNTITHNIIY